MDWEKVRPLVVTNDANGTAIIEAVVSKILHNPQLDTIIVVAPYFSNFFINMIMETPVKHILIIIDKKPPDYTLQAIAHLFQYAKSGKITVHVKHRPKTASFMHLKCMIPLYNYWNAQTRQMDALPVCAFTGSVNWTRGGVRDNDEMLVILRDDQSVRECWKKLDQLWRSSITLQ